eukprot:1156593-Pelagomonas_calceolata.AAC.8
MLLVFSSSSSVPCHWSPGRPTQATDTGPHNMFPTEESNRNRPMADHASTLGQQAAPLQVSPDMLYHLLEPLISRPPQLFQSGLMQLGVDGKMHRSRMNRCMKLPSSTCCRAELPSKAGTARQTFLLHSWSFKHTPAASLWALGVSLLTCGDPGSPPLGSPTQRSRCPMHQFPCQACETFEHRTEAFKGCGGRVCTHKWHLVTSTSMRMRACDGIE